MTLQEMVDDWNQTHGDIFFHFECKDGLRDMGEAVNPNDYSPFNPTRRSLLISNLGGGI